MASKPCIHDTLTIFSLVWLKSINNLYIVLTST